MLLSWVNVVVIAGSPSAEVRSFPTGAVSRTIIDLHLELFLDETKKLAQSVVECVKENGVGPSIDEVIGVVLLFQQRYLHFRCNFSFLYSYYCSSRCCYISNSHWTNY